MEYSADPLSKLGHVRASWLPVLLLSVLLASAFVTPMMFLGNASGHDFEPHVASWVEAAAQWRAGYWFPRWASGANYGYGEPRFIFYPPVSWMLGATLGAVLPWRMVPGAFVWLTVVLASISMWLFAREWLSPTQAIVASFLFVINPYTLALIYYRSDFAEFLAGALFPLLILGTVSAVQGDWRRVPLLALVVAGIWLSNAPAAVIATYSMVLMLVVGCLVQRNLTGLLIGGCGLVSGLLLSAFYIIPAWWEQRYVQIGEAATARYSPEKNFLFSRLNDPDFNWFNWKISAIAVALIVFTLFAIVLSLRQQTGRTNVWWMVASVFTAAVILMFPFSNLLWRYLPELHFLQFPWRWLLILSVSFAFFGAMAGRSWWISIWWLTLTLVSFAAATSIAGDTGWDSDDLNTVVQSIQTGKGYEGIEGFEPRGAKVDELDEDAALVSVFDPASGEMDEPDDTKIVVDQWTAERKSFDVTTAQSVDLAAKLFNYFAWEARVDNDPSAIQIVPSTGQIVVPVNSGTHRVELYFRRTLDRVIGGGVSAASLLIILWISVFLRRRQRTEVSWFR